MMLTTTTATGSARVMIRRHAIALSTASALIALATLAYASPPDPVWVRGIYDDADYDDIVASIASGVAVVEASAPVGGRPIEHVAPYLLLPAQESAAEAVQSSNPVRAPPRS